MDIPTTAPSIAPPRIVQPSKTSYRIDSIDLLRGLVMIIMALDHTRDFFHKGGMISDPLDLSTTTPFLYFTRWITHFCAPIFVFLSGTSAWLQSLRKSKSQLSGFLIKRGLWLIAIEVIVMTFAFTFNVHYNIIFLQTIWSIGISMVILGLAIWLPFPLIVALGFIIVLGHNALDFTEQPFPNYKSPGWFYDLLHHQNFYNLWDNHGLVILYPFLPWTGLMFLGYGFGKLFTTTRAEKRNRLLLLLGGSVILFFIILRATNLYGDSQHWTKQKNLTYTFLSFMNVVKYPPSLLFMCATVGPGLIFLGLFSSAKSALAKFITVFGRVPFFYYIIHFYVLHAVSMILFFSRGHSFQEGLNNNFPFKFLFPTEGYSLGIVYLVWFLVILALYPLCKWFSEYKLRHREKWWLSYL